MLNNALYQSTLFLTGGAVERQAGSTDLKQVSGLGRLMPVTFGCFLVAAFSISGFPLTNGFYSKEFVYHGAWERGWYFYAIAALGSFFTAASFLKLGHAAFLGPHQAPKPKTEIKDPPLAMLVPMVVIAAACVLFGTGNGLVIDGLIIPGLPARYLEEASKLSGVIPHEWWLVGMTILVLALAFANHWYGFKTRGSGLKAVDHIHYAPVAHQLYDAAEKRWFDPYVLAIRLIDLVAYLGWLVDRVIDFVYNKLVTGLAEAASRGLRKAHDGSHATYLIWSVMGAALVLFYFVGGF
jgi:NADH:ubiquinone oxidoreductase subunit 5 (subunit L)/multisubunit Na+/H+ antiporter MnhA subunit